jgi:glycerol-3-phosphate O-acyltransferase
LSVRAYCREQGLNFSKLARADRFPEIEKLCLELTAAIGAVVPILPLSLVATVFLESMDTAMDILQIEEHSNQLINELQARGAPILQTSHSTRTHAIVEAVEVMLMRRMIAASGNKFKAIPEEEAILRYYANSIGHWVTRPSQNIIKENQS